MNKYSLLALFGFAVWIVETAYFGYNVTAQTPIEHVLDVVSWVFIFWGIIGDILNNVTINKTINTHSVVIGKAELPSVKGLNVQLDMMDTAILGMQLIEKQVKKEVNKKVAVRKAKKNGK